MSPREIASRALDVSANEIVCVDAIKHGLTNESWLVRSRNDAVVVHMSDRHWGSLQIDRVTESIVLDAVARAGIGPVVLASDIHRGVLVTRYMGPTCTEQAMTQPSTIERVGKTFRLLHELTVPNDVREVHLPSLIGGYLDTLDTLGVQLPLTTTEMRERGLSLASQIADSSAPRLCHNDVHHLNAIDSEPMRFIDWEYAGVGEPYFDLASVCVYHDYSMDQRIQLLRAYAGACDAAALERLAKCCWLFEYVRELWTQVRERLAEK